MSEDMIKRRDEEIRQIIEKYRQQEQVVLDHNNIIKKSCLDRGKNQIKSVFKKYRHYLRCVQNFDKADKMIIDTDGYDDNGYFTPWIDEFAQYETEGGYKSTYSKLFSVADISNIEFAAEKELLIELNKFDQIPIGKLDVQVASTTEMIKRLKNGEIIIGISLEERDGLFRLKSQYYPLVDNIKYIETGSIERRNCETFIYSTKSKHGFTRHVVIDTEGYVDLISDSEFAEDVRWGWVHNVKAVEAEQYTDYDDAITLSDGYVAKFL